MLLPESATQTERATSRTRWAQVQGDVTIMQTGARRSLGRMPERGLYCQTADDVISP